MRFLAITGALILTSVINVTLVWAADSMTMHKITVRNKCKEEFSMIIPGRGIFYSAAPNYEDVYTIFGDFKNVTASAAVGNGVDCGFYEKTASGPCTTAVFSLNDGHSTGHIDLVPPHKFNYPLRMRTTDRISQVTCDSASCTSAVRKAGSFSKGQEMTDINDFAGMILEFCY